ncbi:MAG: hypothetical protein Fur0046_22540 [Cyanobacteria bacterium J069]
MRSSSESFNQNSLNLIRIDSLDSLEQLTNAARLQKSRTLGKWFEAFLNRFGGEPEPRVWQTSDRAGRTTWHAYDPISNTSARFASESEVRIWLEERYRQ